jgi:hypothetical protein
MLTKSFLAIPLNQLRKSFEILEGGDKLIAIYIMRQKQMTYILIFITESTNFTTLRIQFSRIIFG